MKTSLYISYFFAMVLGYGCAANRNMVPFNPLRQFLNPAYHETTSSGVIFAATSGGTQGELINEYMNRQAEKLRSIPYIHVERIGEGIKLTIDNSTLFEQDSSILTQPAKAILINLGSVLREYSRTNVLITCYTDLKDNEHSLFLSESKAQTISNYLKTLGLAPERFRAVGHGSGTSSQDDDMIHPKRRIEVAIYASEEMKRDARKGLSLY